MSFPYRLITLVTLNSFVVVVSLRFISIALFAIGLILFKKVLSFISASKALINFVLLAFVLLPVVTFTAAQINYDNLLFPATGAALLFSLRFVEKLKNNNKFDVKLFMGLAITCLLGSQVKYSFLPIFAAIGVFIAYIIAHWWLNNRQSAWQNIQAGFLMLSNQMKLLLLGLLVLSTGLFCWRFGYNLIRYDSLIPDCNRVMTTQSCLAYGAWARNYQLGLEHTPAASLHQGLAFARVWVHIIDNELFTILNGNNGGAMVAPFRLLVVGGSIILVVGILLILWQWRKFIKIGYPVGLFVIVSAIYVLSLLLKNYSDYTNFGIPIAVQGRYLLPVLPLLLMLVALAYSLLLPKKPKLKLLLLLVCFVLDTQGGGLITYLSRTNQSWYWNNISYLQK